MPEKHKPDPIKKRGFVTHRKVLCSGASNGVRCVHFWVIPANQAGKLRCPRCSNVARIAK